jgi:hypothetical protein
VLAGSQFAKHDREFLVFRWIIVRGHASPPIDALVRSHDRLTAHATTKKESRKRRGFSYNDDYGDEEEVEEEEEE